MAHPLNHCDLVLHTYSATYCSLLDDIECVTSPRFRRRSQSPAQVLYELEGRVVPCVSPNLSFPITENNRGKRDSDPPAALSQ